MRRWPYTFGVSLSIVVGVTAIIAAQRLDVPLRDPDGFLGPAYVRLPLIGLMFFAAGIIPMAVRRGWRDGIPGIVGEFRGILKADWSLKRVGYIATGLLTFYVCYVSYRNLKSDLPLIRKGVLFDTDMLRLDHYLFFGHNPAEVLHSFLGTSVAAQVLATAYVSYLPLIPLTLGAFLVWGKDLSLGAWYATALSLNWILGVVSYYSMPTLGPAFAQSSMFQDLPVTGVTELQRSLFRAGSSFKEDPTGSASYGIAGFASLHVSVVVTACIFFERTGQKLVIRVLAWAFLVMTVLATIYFGWHYLADDIAGAFIGWLSVSIAAWATGNRGRRRRSPEREREIAARAEYAEPTPEPAS
ncbi:phosphatase PAP2 family protein [Aeromicrobium panaciterrae]|uniref:phosphatase PAP2 family protein n=1 Tax=Aeromicrobium panaciterrae TaxID=363861 RepID=UPI0031DD458F